MKIAEALAERADLDKRLQQLSDRIRKHSRYAEGEEPAESAVELLEAAETLLLRRELLIGEVNARNAAVTVTIDGTEMTVTSALAWRDRLMAHRNLLTEVANAAGGERDMAYYGRRRSELPMKTDLPVRDIRARADDLAKRFREVDTVLQQSNWSTDL